MPANSGGKSGAIWRLGASLSPAIGGWIVQEIGYSAIFMILGSFALGSVALRLGFAVHIF